MALSLRNPEAQAKLSGVLVAASIATFLAAAAIAMVKGGYSWEDRLFIYSSGGLRAPMVFAMAAFSFVLACGAFWFAYASAGERRNTRNGLSWTSFALSALIIVFSLVFLYAYRSTAFVQG